MQRNNKSSAFQSTHNQFFEIQLRYLNLKIISHFNLFVLTFVLSIGKYVKLQSTCSCEWENDCMKLAQSIHQNAMKEDKNRMALNKTAVQFARVNKCGALSHWRNESHVAHTNTHINVDKKSRQL